MVSRSQHAVMCRESITRQARAVPSSKCSKQFMSYLPILEYHSAIIAPICPWQICTGSLLLWKDRPQNIALVVWQLIIQRELLVLTGWTRGRLAAKDTRRLRRRVHHAIDNGVVLHRTVGKFTHLVDHALGGRVLRSKSRDSRWGAKRKSLGTENFGREKLACDLLIK